MQKGANPSAVRSENPMALETELMCSA